jgi:hypothetical protein
MVFWAAALCSVECGCYYKISQPRRLESEYAEDVCEQRVERFYGLKRGDEQEAEENCILIFIPYC